MTCRASLLRGKSRTYAATSTGDATTEAALIRDTGTPAETPPAQGVEKLLRLMHIYD